MKDHLRSHWLSTCAAGLAAAMLLACDNPDAPAPAASASAAASASPAPGPLKIAFVYVGPVGDAGWTFAHDQARKAVADALGSRVQTSFVENVPEGADAERVLRDLVR